MAQATLPVSDVEDFSGERRAEAQASSSSSRYSGKRPACSKRGPPPEPALRRYIARMLAIFEAPAPASDKAANELEPRALELSPEAREVWIAFHDAVETAMRPDGSLAGLRDVAGKAAEPCGRVAGVLQIVDDAGAASIGVDAVGRACEIVDWRLREAARLASESLIPPVIRDAQVLLDWLHRRGLETVTAATLQKTGPGPLRRKARLDPAIDTLEEHRWLVPVDLSRRAWRVEGRVP